MEVRKLFLTFTINCPLYRWLTVVALHLGMLLYYFITLDTDRGSQVERLCDTMSLRTPCGGM